MEFTRTIATATNITVPIINATNNVSYATGANNTNFYITKQTGEAAFGAFAVAGANISIIGTSGIYNFPLNATEMDTSRIGILYNETGCLQQFVVVNTVVQAAINVIDGIVDAILADTETLGALTNVTLAGTQAYNVTGNVLGNVTAVTNDVGITQAGADKAWGTASRTLTGTQAFNVTGNVLGNVTAVTNDVGITQAGADKAWGTAARTLTALDEDSTTIDLNATYVGGVTTFDEDSTTIDINATVLSVTTAGIADAVWDEARGAHTGAGTFGLYLDAQVSTVGGGTAADIADAVWDEATADHVAAGSTDKAITDAQSAGDPWSTDLPGSYTGDDAGVIINTIYKNTKMGR